MTSSHRRCCQHKYRVPASADGLPVKRFMRSNIQHSEDNCCQVNNHRWLPVKRFEAGVTPKTTTVDIDSAGPLFASF